MTVLQDGGAEEEMSNGLDQYAQHDKDSLVSTSVQWRVLSFAARCVSPAFKVCDIP